MINRRHIRLKVMQSVYAMLQSHNTDIEREEKFLQLSIRKMVDLYALNLDLLVKVQRLAHKRMELSKKKIFATKEELNPNTKFVNNKLINIFAESISLEGYLELNNLDYWKTHDEFVRIILDELQESDLYRNYMNSEDNSAQEDRKFILSFFKEIIAPNEKLAEFYEDKMISWVDDIPFVNTWVVKTLENQSLKKPFILSKLFKNDDDKQFVSDLFRKTMLHQHEYEDDIQSKTPNWEVERISDIDMILIKMGVTEFLYFPSIPVRVTINEYIELSKDYSTEKSGRFINGVLDKLSKEYIENEKLNKIGRGLV